MTRPDTPQLPVYCDQSRHDLAVSSELHFEMMTENRRPWPGTTWLVAECVVCSSSLTFDCGPEDIPK